MIFEVMLFLCFCEQPITKRFCFLLRYMVRISDSSAPFASFLASRRSLESPLLETTVLQFNAYPSVEILTLRSSMLTIERYLFEAEDLVPPKLEILALQLHRLRSSNSGFDDRTGVISNVILYFMGSL